jgi:flagellar motor protein MotB
MDKKKIALIVASVLGFTTTQAALNIYTNEVEIAEDAANAGNYEFSQMGLSGEEAMVVAGFGQQMPLDLSLQIIVPNDWKVNLNAAASKMPVDWKGKTTWPYVLEQLAIDHNLQVSIDWKLRVVSVFSKEAEEVMIAKKEKEIKVAEEKKVALRDQARAAALQAEKVRKEVIVEEKRLAKEQQKLAEAKQYARLEKTVLDEYKQSHPGSDESISSIFLSSNVLPLDRKESTFVEMMAKKTLREYDEAIYIIQEERMLSDNITDWATANGWRVVWNADADFRITNQFEERGTMLEVIDKVIGLYKKSKKPLMVEFFVGNKVIEVKDFNYEK